MEKQRTQVVLKYRFGNAGVVLIVTTRNTRPPRPRGLLDLIVIMQRQDAESTRTPGGANIKGNAKINTGFIKKAQGAA